ncbi:MAG TPA: dihydrofolate reductase family protein [Pseudolysinimonas sp.]|nr:dihydrofolate reductase family protein [Pseudolysinimonas sp.]
MGIIKSDLAVSVDGFVAGPDQSLDNPLGIGGMSVHEWQFGPPAEANKAEIDGIVDAGAVIMGRNMFAPGRGDWDLDWTGWWGDDPPYHAPVFVLTHYERPPVEMQGGTTFHFVTDGIESALGRAREVAGDRDVSIAGGASTVNQFLAAGLLDELRLHVAPVTLGAGERLFDGVPPLRMQQVSARQTPLVTHLVYRLQR